MLAVLKTTGMRLIVNQKNALPHEQATIFANPRSADVLVAKMLEQRRGRRRSHKAHHSKSYAEELKWKHR